MSDRFLFYVLLLIGKYISNFYIGRSPIVLHLDWVRSTTKILFCYYVCICMSCTYARVCNISM